MCGGENRSMPTALMPRRASLIEGSRHRRRPGRRTATSYVLTAAAYYPAMVSQDHYFTPDPTVASRPRTIRVTLADLELRKLDTDRGVFAHGHLDFGTDLLLRTLPPVPAGEVIDVRLRNTGRSPSPSHCATRRPGVAVDVNRRALDLCARNAERAGARNVVTAEPDAVPGGIQVAAVYSNPPVRLGKEGLHELLLTWIGTDPARSRWRPWWSSANLGADSLAGWLAGPWSSRRTGQVEGRLYRVLEVHAAGLNSAS